MRLDELIYGLITVILMGLFLLSPILKKIAKSKKLKGDSPLSDSIKSDLKKGSKETVSQSPSNRRDLSGISFTDPFLKKTSSGEMRETSREKSKKIDNLTKYKKAILWSEILSPPLALRDLGRGDHF